MVVLLCRGANGTYLSDVLVEGSVVRDSGIGGILSYIASITNSEF